MYSVLLYVMLGFIWMKFYCVVAVKRYRRSNVQRHGTTSFPSRVYSVMPDEATNKNTANLYQHTPNPVLGP